MTGRLPLGPALPADVPGDVRLLGRCAARGLPVPPGFVLLDGPVPQEPDLLVRAFDDAAWSLAGDAAATGGAVVLRAVESVHAGTARRSDDLPYDVVHALEGRVTDVRPGAGLRELHVPRYGRFARVHRGADEWRTPLPPWGMRLARLVRRTARVTGGVRELTWADDGRTCWLLAVRGRMQG